MPDLKLITEFGSFGVIAILLWMQWDKDKRFTKVVGNHLEHETLSRGEHTKALTSLTEVIRSLKERMDRK